jgi:hypothetical protein
MNSTASWIFFAAFGIVLIAMYLAIRRRWAAPTLVAALGVFASILLITLMSLAQGNVIYQAIFVGLLVGGLFSAGTLAMAWYFTSHDQRAAPLAPESTQE